MEVINNVSSMQKLGLQLLRENRSHGFVPTMGALHEGHLSLAKQSINENDITTASIYVNPTQFGPNEDLDKYPRTLESDIAHLEKLGTDYLFLPSDKEMYQPGYQTYIYNEKISQYLCGSSRPTHFRGVTTIVTKLFNIVQPTNAYFGQKDYQQSQIIKQLVLDLNMPVNIVVCPIVREEDGLAMSSRNKYLSDEERKQAIVLRKAIELVKSNMNQGMKSSDELRKSIEKHFENFPKAKIDYIEFCNADTLEPASKIEKGTLLALAAFLGSTRIIDNIIL